MFVVYLADVVQTELQAVAVSVTELLNPASCITQPLLVGGPNRAVVELSFKRDQLFQAVQHL